MKILHLTTYKDIGGAGICVSRINESINKYKEVKSEILSIDSINNKRIFIVRKIKNLFIIFLRYLAKSSSRISPIDFALIPSNISKKINKLNYDIVNLHWVNSEFISIEDISKINRPIFWTLHDCWPLNGCFHYYENNKFEFYKTSPIFYFLKYLNKKRLINLSKKKEIIFICPSKWIYKEWQKSFIYNSSKAVYIPNPLDTEFFKPLQKNLCRKEFNLPLEKKLIFFCAENANTNIRKGRHFLEKIIFNFKFLNLNVEFVSVGSNSNSLETIYGYKIHNFVFQNEKLNLVKLYSACDLSIIPSIIDNLPQVGTESASCGLPILSFDVGGLRDIVKNDFNGYLIPPFNTKQMSNKIYSLLNDEEKINCFSKNSRKFAIESWNQDKISKMYIKVYQENII